MKILFPIILIACLVGLFARLDGTAKREPTRHVMSVSESVYATGQIEGLTQEIELRPSIMERIVSIPITENQQVHAGQVLVTLEDTFFSNRLRLAEAEREIIRAERQRIVNGARVQERRFAIATLAAKESELAQARRQLDRHQKLLNEQASTQQIVDDARSRVNVLSAQADAAAAKVDQLNAAARDDDIRVFDAKISAADAAIELAKAELAKCQLRSPIRGQILHIANQVGEVVSPNSPEPMIILADTSRYRARCFVEEFDAERIELGMRAFITAEGWQAPKTGTVTRLSSRMERKTHASDSSDERFDTKTREVWIDIDDSDSNVIGMRVHVRINLKLPPAGTHRERISNLRNHQATATARRVHENRRNQHAR